MGKADEREPVPADPGFDGFVTAVLAASWLLGGISARSVEGVDANTTMAQFRTMAVLSRRGSINLSRLATDLGVNVSTAMRSVDRLIGAGYAMRSENPTTRREVVLCLTPEGEQCVTAVFGRRRAEITVLLAEMPDADRELLVSGLRSFVDTAERAGLLPATPAALGW